MHLLCLFYYFAFHKKHIYFSNCHFFWHLCDLWAMCENTHISTLQFLLKKLFILQMYINAFCSMLKLFSLLFFSISHFRKSVFTAIQFNICFKSFSNCCLNDILSLTMKRNKWKFLEHGSHQKLFNKNNTINYI